MKDNKYYTPLLEEFYVGFEFEHEALTNLIIMDMKEDTSENVTDKNRFIECKFLETSESLISMADFNMLPGMVESKKVRVKYLDQEDIESFGFKFRGKTIDNWYKLEGNFEIPISNCRNKQIILQHDFRTQQGVRIVGYEFDEHGCSETLYRGSCKNKSEFGKILTQIGLI